VTGGASPGFARGRRLRSTPALRRLTAQTRLAPPDFVLPVFVKQGIDAPVAISSMPGVVQHTLDSVRKAAHEAAEAGIGGLMLFGIPGEKDPVGSQADAADGIVNVALRQLRADLGDELVLMADLCLCEYTDHGHCGVITPARGGVRGQGGGFVVDNDPTLDRYAAVAIAQAQAGAHVIAPSGMMDGQVAAIRRALDGGGFPETPILAYAAKYASGFYGPFREAAEGAPQFGDRSTYQMDPPNADEALREVAQDLAEGADAVMVKPALPYLDIVTRVADAVHVPVSAYQVSGEYAMVEAAAANGWVDRERAILETLTAIRRAGAGTVLTYWAVVAIVAVLGVVGLGVLSSRRVWTVRVDGEGLSVGREQVRFPDIDVAHLRSVDSGVDAGAPVLGGGWSLPRGRTGLPLKLTDGRTVLVPTREPAALYEALMAGVGGTPDSRPGSQGTLGS
jgi:porphobilinogen synthase